MAGGRIVQAVFNGGELSPRYQDRADLEVFAQGASRLENLIVLREGGAIRRSGFEFVARVEGDKPGALLSFTKSNQDAVVIEATDACFRFIDAQTCTLQKTALGAPVKLTTPYRTAELGRLYEWQSADVMWLTQTDGDRAPHVLIRYQGDDWAIEPYELTGGPFLGRSFDGATIQASAVTGSNVTLSSSADVFKSGHVGALWILYEQPGSAESSTPSTPYKLWKADEEGIAPGDLRSFSGRIYRAVNAGTSGNQPPVHERDTVSDGSVQWEYMHDGAGVVRITQFTSARQVRGEVLARLPATTPTKYWAEGAFSDVRGFPRLGGIFEERLFFLSTQAQPDTMFASRAGEYSPFTASFKPGLGSGAVVDSDAITRTLADAQVNQPAWMIARDRLLFGTPRGVVRVSGPSIDEALVPASAVARRIPNSVGAFSLCRAVEANERVLYPATAGRRLIELDPDRLQTRDLTVRAEHVGAEAMMQIVWVAEPDNRAYMRRTDGTLWCLSYVPDENVIGWSRILPGGDDAFVESLTTAPDEQGRDRLWILVRRGSVRTIERMALDYRLDRQYLDEACFVDSAVRWNTWNADPAKIARLTLNVGGNLERGDQGVVTMDGDNPFHVGHVGAEFWLHHRTGAGVDTDPPAPLRLKILTVTSKTQVSVELLTDGDARQMETHEWAFPVVALSNLDHLAGRFVGLFLDGVDRTSQSVVADNGTLTLPDASARGCVGYPTRWLGRSMPVIVAAPRGDSRGASIRVEAMRVGYVDAVAGTVQVVTDDHEELPEDVITRAPQDPIGAALKPRSGQWRSVVSARRAKKVQVQVSGTDAYPFTLTSVTAEVVLDD